VNGVSGASGVSDVPGVRVDLTAFDALSFDVYGTLIDWEAGISAVLVPWAARRGVGLGAEELLAAYAGDEEAVEREFPSLVYPEVLQASFRRLAGGLGAAVSDDEVQALGRSVPSWPAFDDTSAALARLAQHYRLVILSNVHREGVTGSIARMGSVFSEVAIAEDIGSYKPSPRNFAVLLSRVSSLGVAPERLLHVAQSLFHDHVPAQAAGLRTVWINRRHAKPGWGATPPPSIGVVPDAEFASLAQFADAVDAAFASRDGGAPRSRGSV
jgi:2-haloalkanoic acid dehalogenase type II